MNPPHSLAETHKQKRSGLFKEIVVGNAMRMDHVEIFARALWPQHSSLRRLDAPWLTSRSGCPFLSASHWPAAQAQIFAMTWMTSISSRLKKWKTVRG
jgi:hypothetical protein